MSNSRLQVATKRMRIALAFAGTAMLAIGCGGGGAPPALPTEPPMQLAASVAGCERSTVHDSGHVVYVVLARDCPAEDGDPHRLTLGMSRTASPDLSQAVSLSVETGAEPEAVDIPRLGTRQLTLVRAGTWRMFPNTDSWQPRDGAGLLLMRGELYLLGGWAWGPVTSEVWKTRDLVHWEQLTPAAPWPGRHGAGWLVHDDRLWVIGGDLNDDVWSSADGVEWREETAHAPFGKRYTPNAASLDGYIVVYAGQSWGPTEWCAGLPDCYSVGPRDVWISPDGRNWERATPEAPWAGRGLIHGSVVHDGEIFLIGGGFKMALPGERYAQTIAESTDIWSSKNAKDWVLRTDNFSFAPRTHFSVLSTPFGCFVSDGSVGTQVGIVNDLLLAPDCIHFEPVPEAPPLKPRHASSLAYFNGSVVILGGPSNGGVSTEVWQYFP
jgi:hypothetical protein